MAIELLCATLVYSNVPLSLLFPLLLRLANNFETNPVDQRSGPRPLPVFTVRARTRKTSH